MKGRVLGGRYALEKRIGEGGMGVVYRARDRVSNDCVAVKIIRSDISCEARAVQRFFREAKAASSLSHESIVRVIDEGTDVEHYIVMEFVEGVTIREWVRTFGRAPRTLVPLLGDILQALHHAHSRGIIHRDIKPENIIVTPARRAKLMDFGLARPMNVRGVTITQEGAVVGTVAYMSPEQASGKRGDERSDLYSLGVVAYELFSGKRPFSSDSPMNVLIKHIQEEPVPPRRHNPGLPAPIEDVILTLLSKRPEDRYPSALAAIEGFRQALEQSVTRRPRLLTQPPSSPDKPTEAAPPLPQGAGGREATRDGAEISSPRGRVRGLLPFDDERPTEVTPVAAAPSPPRPRRISTRRPPLLPGGVLPGRRPSPTPADAAPEPLIEVSVLYTRVQMLQELLDQHSALEALEAVGMYERTVEAIAAIHRGRVLDGTGSTQILVFDGTAVPNPVATAVKTVRRMKQEVCDLAMRSGSGDNHGSDPELFLSAGIFTSYVRPSKEGSVEEPVRRDMLNGARRLHDLSAAERKYCMLCESSWSRVKEEVEPAVTPFKRVYISGIPKPLQVYELAALPEVGGREVGVAG
jgi:serine/threonine protein kinase